MALNTVDKLALEVVDRVGGRSELGGDEGTPPGGRCIRALNDALQEVVLTYRLEQYEAEPPYYFTSNVYTTGTASNSANGVTVTGSGTLWATAANATVGWLFKFDSDNTWHEIVSIGGNTSLTVSPRITSANTGGTYAIVQNRFAFPTSGSGSPSDVFCIFDVRDVESQRRILAADNRLLDKSQLVTGNPQFYTRWKDSLILWPAPDTANVYYRVRYIKRPAYVSYTDGSGSNLTFSPLPEEWQEVVVLLATSKVLASLMEMERSDATKKLAIEKAESLMKAKVEESEDFDVAVRPKLWSAVPFGGR